MAEPSASRHQMLMILNIVMGTVVLLVVILMIRSGRSDKNPIEPKPEASLPPVSQAAAPPLTTVPVSDPQNPAPDNTYLPQEAAPADAVLIKDLPAQIQRQTKTLLEETEAARNEGRTNDPLVLTQEEILTLEKEGRVIF